MEGSVAFSGTLIGGITGGGEGTNDYNQLINKPSINGMPLSGNKSSSDLHLFTGDYPDLTNKPTINGVTVEGNLTSADLNMFDGDYDHLTNKPTLFSGDYDDLTDKPTINGNTLVGNKTTSDLGLFSGNYNDLTNKPTLFSGDYDDLTDKPRINNHTLSGNMSSADLDIFSGDYNDLTNKPTLFSGDYNDLTNKPTIPVIEFNPVAAAVDEVDKASLNGVIYDIKDSAARSDAGLAIENAAAVYDPEGEYLVGDYCTHDGIMYQCNTAIVSPGETWDPDHWDVTDCGIELTEINTNLTAFATWENVELGTPTSGTIQSGTYLIKNSALHLAILSIQWNGMSANATVDLNVDIQGTLDKPIYGWNSYNNRQVNGLLRAADNKLEILEAQPLARLYAVFPIE